MTQFLDKGWYLLFWLLIFCAARWFLVNPMIRSDYDNAERVIRAIEHNRDTVKKQVLDVRQKTETK